MRCYNGCPDSELQALLDNRERLRRRLVFLDPNARSVYFPADRAPYSIWSGIKQITKDYPTVESALIAGIRVLEDGREL